MNILSITILSLAISGTMNGNGWQVACDEPGCNPYQPEPTQVLPSPLENAEPAPAVEIACDEPGCRFQSDESVEMAGEVPSEDNAS